MKKLSLILFALLTTAVYSQDASLDSIALSEVTVTSKVVDVAKERETPIAFSTVTGAEIELKGGNLEFVETLRRTPGVYTNQDNGGYGDGQMYLRGFGFTNTAYVINGQPVNDMENGRVYWSNWAGLMDIASSVQLQRGLGSTSLAVPSAGGTVSVNTRAAEATPGSGLKLMLGDNGYQKTTAYMNTGVNELGWSSSYLLGFWQGDGWRNGMKGEGVTYAFSVGYTPRGGDHEFNLSVIGAGQWHHQAYYGTQIQDYLDYGPAQGDDFRKFNQLYGDYKGEEFSVLRNYYHKPLATLNWDWEISSRVTLATSLYASAGRGGGTGLRGRGSFGTTSFRESFSEYMDDHAEWRNSDYTINWNTAVSKNLAGAHVPDSGPFAGMNLGYHNTIDGLPSKWGADTTVRRFSTNSHNWIGGISKIKIDSDNFRYELGVDLRSYKAYHRRGISDFLGLDGYISTINGNNFSGNGDRIGTVVTTAYESSPFKNLGMDDPNGTQRYYIGYNDWTGINGLIEYVGNDKFSAVLQLGSTTQKYQIEHFYTTQPDTKSRKITVNGGYIKGGANYNMTDRANVFINVGQISRPPLVDGVFTNADYDFTEAEDITSEKITSFELGYGYTGSNFKAKVNAYSTVWGDRTFSRSTSIGDQGITIIYDGVEQTHNGIEGEFTWFPSSRLRLRGMASLGDWKFSKNFNGTSFYNDNGQAAGETGTLYLDGVKIGDAAQTVLYLGANYKLSDRLSADIDFQTYSNLHGRFSPLDSEFFSSNNRGSIELPSFSLVDIGATYKTTFLGYETIVRANINNLFDEEYISQSQTNLHNDGGRAWNGVNVENLVYFGKGTTWNLGATFRF